ncbi:MAG TPA: trigger factor [Gammaproteobacteria bacterium]|nr:trigger factor [bacterium BMS3Abin11]GMT41071.1 MAG: trigger factor [bacterium]HDH15447.1 trigger factor [Gammaproteobacteria bacterium]HDZ78066.1 trigger factor [Gammaproteobacteria bacterium]
MQVSLEQSGNIERKMTISVPAERVDSEITKQLQRLSKQVKVPGFRPGKIPMKIMRTRYLGQVMQDVIGDLIQSSYQEALGQKSIRPAGPPSIETSSGGEGKDLEYIATFEVFPDLKELALTGLKVERTVCEISDQDIETTLESLRRQRINWNKTDGKAKDGCRVILDFTGSVDGSPFVGGEGKAMPVVIGSGTLVAGFEDQLIGLKEGEERSLTVTFPDDYHTEELAGKEAVFEVKATEVAEEELPEIDEELAEAFGVKEGGMEKFREEIRENLSREAEDRLAIITRDTVFQAVLENNEIDLPQVLVNQEKNLLIETAEKEQPDIKKDENMQAMYGKLAERRVALGLILAEITENEKMLPDANAVETRLHKLAETYEDPASFVEWYKSDRGRLSEIEAQVLENMVVDKLLEDAEITDKTVCFQELVNPATIETGKQE